MGSFGFALLSSTLVILTAVVAGLYPLRVALSDRGERRLMLGNALAGGVFLGAALLHMLPDAVTLYGQVAAEGATSALGRLAGEGAFLPLPFLLMGFGYLLVLLLETVILRGEGEEDLATAKKSLPLLLFVILSVHSVIAGLALGLESDPSTSLAILVAILAHKGFAAFALGVSLVQAGVTARRVVGTIVAFSLTTPAGVLLGSLASAALDAQSAVGFELLFDGLASGTFLYVGLSEILVEVFEEDVDVGKRFAFVLLGFLVMALLALWS